MAWSEYSPLRRRRLRRAAGDGGPARLLRRVDLPRPVDLRLGPPARSGSTSPPSGRAVLGSVALGVLHPRRELVDAASRSASNSSTAAPIMNDIWAVLTNNTALVAFPHTHLRRVRRRPADSCSASPGTTLAAAPATASTPWMPRAAWSWARTLAHPGPRPADHRVWIKSPAHRRGRRDRRLRWRRPHRRPAGASSCSSSSRSRWPRPKPPATTAPASRCCPSATSAVAELRRRDRRHRDSGAAVVPRATATSRPRSRASTRSCPSTRKSTARTFPTTRCTATAPGSEIDYLPVMEVTYWGFRLMIGFGASPRSPRCVALWMTRKGTVPRSKHGCAPGAREHRRHRSAPTRGLDLHRDGPPALRGRAQPEPGGVDGVFMFTAAAVSPGVSAGEVLFSLISLTLVYGALLVVELVLLVKFVRGGVGVPPCRSSRPSIPTTEHKRRRRALLRVLTDDARP